MPARPSRAPSSSFKLARRWKPSESAPSVPSIPIPESPTFGYITSTPKRGWRNFDFAGAVRPRHCVCRSRSIPTSTPRRWPNSAGAPRADLRSFIYRHRRHRLGRRRDGSTAACCTAGCIRRWGTSGSRTIARTIRFPAIVRITAIVWRGWPPVRPSRRAGDKRHNLLPDGHRCLGPGGRIPGAGHR